MVNTIVVANPDAVFKPIVLGHAEQVPDRMLGIGDQMGGLMESLIREEWIIESELDQRHLQSARQRPPVVTPPRPDETELGGMRANGRLVHLEHRPVIADAKHILQRLEQHRTAARDPSGTAVVRKHGLGA